MNYDAIILEMLSRIKTLEDQVKELSAYVDLSPETTQIEPESRTTAPMRTTTNDIRKYIGRLGTEAKENGETSITLLAGDIHKALKLRQRYPMVCNAMKTCMGENDEILFTTASGYSSTLKIKYYL